MTVVPKTPTGNIVCPEMADMSEPWSGHYVPTPKDRKAVEALTEPGDTLFFHGSLIHGAGPNRSKDRFRRSFIGHYAAGSVEKASKFYFPLLRMDGTEFEAARNEQGGACGQEWLGAVH